MGRPLAVDLFAGAGGMSLGFEQAGFDVAAAVEIDPVHAAVHAFNFPDCAVISRSVVGLSADAIRQAAGIGDRTVSVVCGGAPCQGFSLIGQRQMDDPRNALVREFVRIVADLEADYAVFENVKGLTVGKHRIFLEEIVGEFNKRGYRVVEPWRVLNAAEFGVPQSRERLFLLAARGDLPLPSYPAESTNAAGARKIHEGREPGPTCEEALGDLPDADIFSELLESDEVRVSRWGTSSAYAAELRCERPEDWHYGYRRCWNAKILTCSLRTGHTDISRRRFLRTTGGEVEPISRFFKLAAHGVSNTLRAGTDSARGAFTSPRPIHYRFPRCVTVREMMRLHGFPDWFRTHATKWHGARQVGNAVPPPLARAVARQVFAAGGYEPRRPSEIRELGDTAMLRFDMSTAAAFFGIDQIPIGRRNRKSGAVKRKQSEIEALVAAE